MSLSFGMLLDLYALNVVPSFATGQRAQSQRIDGRAVHLSCARVYSAREFATRAAVPGVSSAGKRSAKDILAGARNAASS